MYTIVILGDSWGEPNWRGPYRSNFTAQGHTEHRLRAQGYQVHNYSCSGRSNLHSWLRLAESPPNKVDYVIWFHTEIARDFDQKSRGLLSEKLDRTADQVYAGIAAIQNQWVKDAHLIVVEGQSQVHQPHFDRYFAHRTLILDWRAHLLEQEELPYTPLLALLCSNRNILDQFTNSLEEKNQWITDTDQVLDLMRASELFPDGCHPGDLAHEQLTKELIRLFRQSKGES